ncbi:MAG: ATP-binding protein [Candidatus Izemoplasmatales bacterium]|nr:ATP-binding protein [Candidatus Izemoplasmatales bacterium]MDD5601614.1 ATP-binding protein [Candidatus Izemoplasmatales bacterium]
MTIAVLSGKGGTGKTVIAVNLASVSTHAVYIDCDVEEPNGHLFFRPIPKSSVEVALKIPVVDNLRCTGCRKCVDFCRFNALAFIQNRLLVFSDLCHACGGCVVLCPEKALNEREMPIGNISYGISENVEVITGNLQPGKVSGVPIIRQMVENFYTNKEIPIYIDCPPGSSCSVMESIKPADYCLIIAESSVFGCHDLKMVHELVVELHKPFGIVLNKCFNEENPSEQYCLENGLPILAKIPFDRELNKWNANGLIAVKQSPDYHQLFQDLVTKIQAEATK